MKIILTGAAGLIGSRFEELMFENHEIIPLSSEDADISNSESVSDFFNLKIKGDIDAIIHLAAKTDVDGCEIDKEKDLEKMEKIAGDKGLDLKDFEKIVLNSKDWSSSSSAFAINYIGTRNLYKEAKNRNIKFVYISTDFVFKGDGQYDEKSAPDPINWYGMTKWYGEKIINTSEDLIARLAFPYGYPSPVKPDFLQRLINFLHDNEEASLIEDQTITPTFIDDVVFGLDFLLGKSATGIYHLTGSSYEDPYHIGHMIKEKFGLNTKIKTAKRDQVYKDKAMRPFKSIVKNDKLKHLGFVPKTFSEGFALVYNKYK